MRAVIALAVCLLLLGCGRFAPGFIITEDGSTLANNDENNRLLAVDCIRRHLDQQLGGHWRTVVSLPELPIYEEYASALRSAQGGWRWAKATVGVELVGDGGAPLPFSEDSIRTVVVDYMEPKVARPDSDLVVTVRSTTDAARFASLGSKGPGAATPTTVSTSSGPRRYTVQAGDTLADISANFYGSYDHVRLIRDANPGLDPADLKPGQQIVIPAKP